MENNLCVTGHIVSSQTRINIFPNITIIIFAELLSRNSHLKRYRHLYAYCSIIYNIQDTEAARVSINR